MQTKRPTKSNGDIQVRVALGGGLFARIDLEDIPRITGYKWYGNRFKNAFYACADIPTKRGKRTIRMHRLIAQTPAGMVTHHVNHNSLDNRRANLRNLTPQKHSDYHSNNNVRVKYADD